MFPATFKIASFTFTGTRAFLLLTLFPVLIAAIRLRPVTVCDVLIPVYGLWAAICFLVNQGLASGIEPAGSHLIEVVGSYWLARVTFGNAETFVFWTKCLFTSVLLLIPLALVETFTTRALVLDTLQGVITTYPNVEMGKRLGLDRVQGVFEHPILFGVFCAGAFSPAVMLLTRTNSFLSRAAAGTAAALATLLSFSTGAYLNIIGQCAFIAWNEVFKTSVYRWRLLAAFGALGYITVDLLSNRTPFEVFITYLTFDVNSAFTRVLTWRFGTAEVFRHPIFGIGFNDWIRPNWLTSSIDNFWLLRAMRFGLPGICFILIAVFSAARGITNRKDIPNSLASRVSITQLSLLAGTCISMVTVDLWSGSHTMFFFLLGSITALSASDQMASELRTV